MLKMKYSTTSKEPSSLKSVISVELASSEITIGQLMTSVHIKQEIVKEFNEQPNKINQNQLGARLLLQPDIMAVGFQISTVGEVTVEHGSTQVFSNKNLKRRAINDEDAVFRRR